MKFCGMLLFLKYRKEVLDEYKAFCGTFPQVSRTERRQREASLS